MLYMTRIFAIMQQYHQACHLVECIGVGRVEGKISFMVHHTKTAGF